MNAKSHATRAKAILGVGMAWALIGGVSAAVATTQVGRPADDPIKSGAGRGWPATLSPNDFVARVDNPWFPLKPGSKYRYTGSKDQAKTVDVVKVTHRTKRILGVKTTVIHDVVSVDCRPEETTNDFYAQDRHGNVWYFGEATKTLDKHGKTVSTEGSFQAGVEGQAVRRVAPGWARLISNQPRPSKSQEPDRTAMRVLTPLRYRLFRLAPGEDF